MSTKSSHNLMISLDGLDDVIKDAIENGMVTTLAAVRCHVCHLVAADVIRSDRQPHVLIWCSYQDRKPPLVLLKKLAAKMSRVGQPTRRGSMPAERVAIPMTLDTQTLIEARCPDHGQLVIDRSRLMAEVRRPPANPPRSMHCRPVAQR